MPPKKKTPKPIKAQDINKSEKNAIRHKYATFRANPQAKAEHWRKLDPLKRVEAEKFWGNLVKNGGTSTPAVQHTTPTVPSSSQDVIDNSGTDDVSTLTDNISKASVDGTEIGDDSTGSSGEMGAKEGDAALETGNGGETAEHGEDAELILIDNLAQSTKDSVAAQTRRSSGVRHEWDEWEYSDRMRELDQATASYPVRTAFQKPTRHVMTNRFEITIDDNALFYEFRIVGIPDGRSKRMNKMFVETAIQESDILNNNRDYFATDNTQILVAWKDLREEFKDAAKSADGYFLANVKDGDYQIAKLYLQFIRVVDTKRLQRYVNSDSEEWQPLKWNANSALTALNIVIANPFGEGVFPQGSNKFFIEAGWEQLNNSPLCTIRGYFFSTRPGLGKILLNVNACTSAFFMPIRLSELMASNSLFGKDYPSILTGLRVFIDYERVEKQKDDGTESTINNDENRIKKISELGLPCNKQKFTWKQRDEEGNVVSQKEIDVERYLREEHQVVLSRPNLAAVNLGSQLKPSWFPPEKLMVMPYQIYRRTVPTDLTSPMLNIACKEPEENRGLIEGEGISNLLLTKNKGERPAHLATVPLKIENSMLIVPADRLQYPKIQYGDNHVHAIKDAEAKWNLANKSFLVTNSSSMSYKFLHSSEVSYGRILEIEEKFAAQLRARNVGLPNFDKHNDVHRIPLTKDITSNGNALRIELRNAKQAGGDLVVLVLRNKDQDIYSTFKYLADKVFGIPTIVMVESSNMRKGAWQATGLDAYVGNIMMKANLKMGGINHSAVSRRKENWLDKTLVLDADVTHPSNGSLPGFPSVAALVGSVESTGGRFIGSMRFQSEGGKEMIEGLYGMLWDQLWDWYKAHPREYPENILYFRDGVADSQYAELKEKELSEIRRCFNDFYEDTEAKKKEALEKELAAEGKPIPKPGTPPPRPEVKITAVVCTKRHHTRCYPMKNSDKQAGNGNNNCKPGLLVDNAITHPFYTDFYLQSHNGQKGTAKAAHYFIIMNEMNMPVSDLQHLIHNLCYTYVRATLGVSDP
ncbi:Piwi domain-containing protein [Paraphoma chrysanthemicola]|uniref:Piwi domain-containing protein n=1 Tax=Paraphoma chrysanthemicola TaxID=798071 RepID=A0A8K0RCX6_9PLEO|nr:Piwi domain-containing protein [Paraphoma chrysanthemicola]